ncbi:molybdopterin biosynthesis protein [Sorangium cellulosum]|uniref:Molybdopterin biosynthesis protein n=1 Tax=Sorangium cellulosum TaxID=56 RepID=A0A150P2R6_SORCE|nr:molybdopterin biosynthesis protein [Sorangium cellulosum]
MRMDGFGMAGQSRLMGATVLISRVGGVGGTAAINMAMAGAGRLILAHGGLVHADYLNRWVWAGPKDIGKPCAEVISAHIRSINPHVETVPVSENITEENVAGLVSQCDLIIDGAPLFEERYLMHREAVRQKKPIVFGAMYSAEGQVTTYVPGETPCFKCIHPERPDYWTNIKVFPAIGPAPLVVGSMAAMEAIKVLTGFGKPLKGVMWYCDLSTGTSRQFRLRRNPECDVCS